MHAYATTVAPTPAEGHSAYTAAVVVVQFMHGWQACGQRGEALQQTWLAWERAIGGVHQDPDSHR